MNKKLYFSFLLIFFVLLLNTNITPLFSYSSTWHFDNASDYYISNTDAVSIPWNSNAFLDYKLFPISNSTITWAFDVVVNWTYAYISNNTKANSGQKIYIVDISNINSPTLINSIDNNSVINWITTELRWEVSLLTEWNYLYAISFTSNSFMIFDISNPMSPITLAKMTSWSSSIWTNYFAWASWIDKVWNLIYISSRYYDWLTIIDVSNPVNPIIKWSINRSSTTWWNISLDWVWWVKAKWNFAYISWRLSWSFIVVDLNKCKEKDTNCELSLVPPLPSTTAAVRWLWTVYWIEVDETWSCAYLIRSWALHIIDISNPYAPFLVKTLSSWDFTFTNSKELLIKWNNLFVSTEWSSTTGWINIFDISEPSNPIFIKKIQNNVNWAMLYWARGMDMQWNYIFVASTNSNALQILEIWYNSSSPHIIANNSFSYDKWISAIFESHWTYSRGMTKYQISNNDWITWNYFDWDSWIETSWWVEDSNTALEINNNIKSLNTFFWEWWNYTFKLFLISDWTKSVELDYVKIIWEIPEDNPLSPTDSSDYIYSDIDKFFFNWNWEIELKKHFTAIWNLVDKSNLYYSSNLVVDWNYAYLISNNSAKSKLNIIDISIPETPVIKRTISHNEILNWQTFSLNNPAIASNKQEWAILKDWDYLYIMSYNDSAFNILNVSNPEEPILLSKTSTPNNTTSWYLRYASHMQKIWDYLFVTWDYYDWVSIYDVSNPTNVLFVDTIRSSTNMNWVYNFKISWDYIFLLSPLDSWNRLVVLKKWNYWTLEYITKYSWWMWVVRDIVINWNHAFISWWTSNQIYVVDISNPDTPIITNNINKNLDTGLALNDDRMMIIDKYYLYVSSRNADTINIIDISNPLQVKMLGKIVNNNTDIRIDWPSWIYKKWKYLYATWYYSHSLQILKETYDTTFPYLKPKYPIHYLNDEYIINSFSTNFWKYNEWVISFQISKDNWQTWYYHNWSTRVQATQDVIQQTSVESRINQYIFNFNELPWWTWEFLFKAFFISDWTQITSLKNVSIWLTEIEKESSNPPTILSQFPTQNQILPWWNFNINISYKDDFWIDKSKVQISIKKWNKTSWWSDISSNFLVSSDINNNNALFNLKWLEYWRYIYSLRIYNKKWAFENISNEFYIDNPQITISTPNYSAWVNQVPDDSITIIVKTIWAPYKINIYKDSPLISNYWDIIIDWDWSSWIWYSSEVSPTWNLKNINSYPIFSSSTKKLNTNWELNVYEHKLKLWSENISETQSAWIYSTNISIKGIFSY